MGVGGWVRGRLGPPARAPRTRLQAVSAGATAADPLSPRGRLGLRGHLSGLSGWSSGWGGGPVGCPRGRLRPARCPRVGPQGPNPPRNAARAPRAGPLFESRTPRTQLPKDRRAGASNQDPIRRATALLVHEDKHITAAFSGMERRSVEGIRKSLEPSGGDRRGRGVTILLHHFYIQECV